MQEQHGLGPRLRQREGTPGRFCRSADPHKIPIDPNGNLTSKTEGTADWVYEWIAENQLTRAEKNGADVARFAYDPLGRRVENIAGGVTTSFTYDDDNILREVRGGATPRYVQDLGSTSPCQWRTGQHSPASMSMASEAS
jgi:YD repeat-containing protein